jgi:hypothetical protein
MTRAQRRIRIKREYRPQYPDPLRAVAGEQVSAGREDETFPGWIWCKAKDGREGWVPVELLSDDRPEATLLEDYSAQELAVQPGEFVMLEDARHDWLRVRNAGGGQGWIPASYGEDAG